MHMYTFGNSDPTCLLVISCIFLLHLNLETIFTPLFFHILVLIKQNISDHKQWLKKCKLSVVVD